MVTKQITAASEPDLDDWGWDDYWTCAQWIEWHKKMVPVWGIDEANARFIYWFNQQSIGAHAIDCRSFDFSFRQYASDNGFLNGLYTGIGGVLATPIGAVTDISTAGTSIVSGAANTAVGTSKSIGNIVKILPYLALIVAILVALYFSYQFLKNKT